MEIRLATHKKVWVKGKKEAVLFDPDEEMLKEKKYEARILAFTSGGQQLWQNEYSEKVVLVGPGEYEVGGVEIVGYNSGEKETIYCVTADGVVVGVVNGLIGNLTDKKIEKIGSVDVLVWNIGDKNKLKTKDIMDLAKKWGANYLIPFGYDDGEKRLKSFLDETDNEGLEPIETLKVDKESLPEGLEVVNLWTK